MKKLAMSAALVIAAGLSVAGAQTPSENPVVRLDPALDAIVSADAKIEVLKDDLGSTEGPVWVRERKSGYLLFSDQVANTIYKWTLDGKASAFLERAGFTGTDPANVGRLLGPNGMTSDRQGRLIVCAQGDRALVRLEKDGTRTILADRYDGKRLNGPNDVVMKSDGAFYFTDRGSGLRAPTDRELVFRGVFRVKDGKVQLLLKDDAQGVVPNGLAFSLDEKHLYLTNEKEIRIFDVQSDGTIANGRLFVDMSAEKTATNDGMKVDRKGNLYATSPGNLWIVSGTGKHLGTIVTPNHIRPTNVAFGDADGKGLYITGGKNLWRIRMNTPAR